MNHDTSSLAPPRELPIDVAERLGFWHGLWRRSIQYHYVFGVTSVAASVISTSLEGGPAKAFSIIAAVGTALIGFMHPERRYLKFVRAWRVLDVAAMRYRHGLIERDALIAAVERGESLIAEVEDRVEEKGAEEARAALDARDAAADGAAPPAPDRP